MFNDDLDIYNIPLHYISFNKNQRTENHCKKQGFNNINHFKAIDGEKFNPKKLLTNNTITIRSYNDLVGKRTQHSGLPGLGAIGCLLSHSLLWEKCVNDNTPYMVIVEEDVLFPSIFSEDDIKSINRVLKKSKGVFMGTKIKGNNKDNDITDSSNIEFQGTQFYIITRDACLELLKTCFPIDVQADYYIANVASVDRITLEGYDLSKQNVHVSDIQNVCIKCMLPDNAIFYIIIIVVFILLLGLCMYKKRSTI